MRNLDYTCIRKSLLPVVFSLLLAAAGVAQPGRAVRGLVTGEQNDPLPGVNISEKGTTTGTISDSEVRYSLNVTGADAILVFSFVGYVTEE